MYECYKLTRLFDPKFRRALYIKPIIIFCIFHIRNVLNPCDFVI